MRRAGTWLGGFAGLLLPAIVAAQEISLEATWDAGSSPAGIALTADGSRLYVADSGDRALRALSTSTGAVASSLSAPAGHTVRFPALSPDGSRVYVLAPPDRVLAVNASTGALLATIPVPAIPNRIAFSSDGSVVALLVLSRNLSTGTSGGPGLLTVYSVPAHAVTAQISVAGVQTVSDVAVSADGTRAAVAVSTFGGARVKILDLVAKTTLFSVSVPSMANAVEAAPGGSAFYAACTAAQRVVRINPAGGAVTMNVLLPARPFRIAFAPGQRYVWALCEGPGTVSAIDPLDGSIAATGSVPGARAGRNDIAFRSDGRAAVVTAFDTQRVYVVATNPYADSFGQPVASLAAGVYVTDVVVAPDRRHAYVAEVSTGAVLAIWFRPGVVSATDAVLWVIDEIEAMLAAGGLPPGAAAELQKALDKLQGQNGGQANNGAIDKLEAGDLTAALSQILLAIRALKDAAAAGADTAALQWMLAEGARIDTMEYVVTREEAGADATAAWGWYGQGEALQDAGEYETAVQRYRNAVGSV